jgi:hypothetical protein
MNHRGRAIPITAPILFTLLFAACSGKPAEAPAAVTPTPAAETPQAPPPAPSASPAAAADTHYSPEQAAGAVKGIPAPTNTAPIVAVANYFTDLPGIDVASLKTSQKERFLQRVNSELCTCGCKNDTLARCYVNDQRCPVVKGMVQKVYNEVKSGR